MRLDAKDLRYVTAEEFRVLKAAETGSLTHEVVPSTLIASTSGLHHAGLNKIMSDLARRGLIGREKNIKYDGWRLTYGGYDWLAVRAMRERNALVGVGTRMGVGKESDIYLAHLPPATDEPDDSPIPAVLKVHRLGRISFRKIKEKRDYLGHRKSAPNWMYLSRLAAKKEWQFMELLFRHGFPVPTPISQSRHAILMSRIDGYPLRQIVDLPAEHVASLYASLMALVVRLARAGLIHGDFNEFNIMVRQVGAAGGDDELEDAEEEERSIWARAQGTAVGRHAQGDAEDELLVKPGQKVERGNGFERVYYDGQAGQPAESETSSSEDEEDDDEEVDEFDEMGTNEGLRIDLQDGTSIEPIVIDFPQMVSVEHPNAEHYFERDVEGVRSFFRRRFRFEGESYPRFRDIVPQDRQQQREARADKRARRMKEAALEKNNVAVDYPEDEQRLGLELDVLGAASGLGSLDETVSLLDQHMTAIKMQDDAESNGKHESEGSDEEGVIQGEDSCDVDDNEDIAARIREGSLLPPSKVEPVTRRGLSHQARRKPERDEHEKRVLTRASRKAAAQNDTESIKSSSFGGRKTDVDNRLAAERRSKSMRDAKHHGKHAQAGKTGRAFGGAGAGSKARQSERAMLDNSMQF